MGYCEQVLVNPFFAAGLNPYDVSKSCTLEELSDGLCYGEKMYVNTIK
jgi:cathepsin A (carboxypeptidase C)